MVCFFWCWKNSQSSTVVSLGEVVAWGLDEALWGRFEESSLDLCTLEGVWVTSERRHWEARKGVGARGRARRPEGVWSAMQLQVNIDERQSYPAAAVEV